MPTINSLLPHNRHTVADTGAVEFLTNMLRRAKKEQDDAARNERVASSPPFVSYNNLLVKGTQFTPPSVTPTEEDDTYTAEDEYETTESALRWARGEDFTIDGFIRLSQPIEKDGENSSHN